MGLSDHFHPWLDVRGHSPFTWTVLGTLAARTERVGLATGVTCPTFRCRPAIVAQAAATTVREGDILLRYADAGFDHTVVRNNGPDPDSFVDFWRRELERPMREMAS